MRYFLMVLAIGATGGAIGTLLLSGTPETQVQHRIEVYERTVQVEVDRPTPILDSLLSETDMAEIERQSDCLFEWLREQVGWDITLEVVVAGGYWTDTLGGACAVMEGK